MKAIKSAVPVNTQINVRKTADMEKVVVVWTEDQTNLNIPLSQRLIRNKALNLFISTKAERGEDVAEKSMKLVERLVHEI